MVSRTPINKIAATIRLLRTEASSVQRLLNPEAKKPRLPKFPNIILKLRWLCW